MAPDAGVACGGNPEAGLETALDQLAAGHAMQLVLDAASFGQLQLQLQLVGREARPFAQWRQTFFAQASAQFQAASPVTGLADEAVVIGKARRYILEVEQAVPLFGTAAPAQPQVVALLGCAQHGRSIGPQGGACGGQQQVAAQQVDIAGRPGEIAATDAVVLALPIAAIRGKQTQIEPGDLHTAPCEAGL
ncbi:hypothetical protein DAPPUDRAFT_346193 [Daphnia pulex]|uniref:Uncharacterized protein n=1 Tax=Daphnia pulex TaxID=6669 RepID=E9I7S7_DAPPU|nr:hypothetical protein DAPPUDRAFT_346193 [Daphnia pulex]|eukprot:EFX59953.1 hypothetical protein DAPPUDRAFT_346193 [Daphnia pulex]